MAQWHQASLLNHVRGRGALEPFALALASLGLAGELMAGNPVDSSTQLGMEVDLSEVASLIQIG